MEEGKKPSMGVWQTLPGSNLSRTMARCGFDWIVVDCEHGNIDGKPIFNYLIYEIAFKRIPKAKANLSCRIQAALFPCLCRFIRQLTE